MVRACPCHILSHLLAPTVLAAAHGCMYEGDHCDCHVCGVFGSNDNLEYVISGITSDLASGVWY